MGRYLRWRKKVSHRTFHFRWVRPESVFPAWRKKNSKKDRMIFREKEKHFLFQAGGLSSNPGAEEFQPNEFFSWSDLPTKKKTTTEPRRTSTDKTKPLSQNFVETSESSDRVGFFAAKSETVILPIFDNFWTLVTSAWNKQKTTAADVIDWIVAIDLYRSLFSSVFFKVD